MRYLTLIALFLMVGCNNEIFVRDGVTDGDTFYLAPVALVDSDPALQSWVAYSLAKSVCQLELGGDNPARQNSYDCEFTARKVLVDTWAEHRAENSGISDDYLDELLAIRDAGYLDEYTVYFFRRDNWQVPVEVDVAAFGIWLRQHLRRHRAQTRIIGYWGYRHKSARSHRCVSLCGDRGANDAGIVAEFCNVYRCWDLDHILVLREVLTRSAADDEMIG